MGTTIIAVIRVLAKCLLNIVHDAQLHNTLLKPYPLK